ncbi:MAG TPA: riboflavin kinase [Candidatus Limnocylindria bacterium]|nr:riboflavin kinase [Candidatus Limnocylindria bacterium]
MIEAPRALGLGELPAIGPAVVTLGVFDGVHLGHAALLAATRRAAAERGAASVALVFDPHPDEVVRPGTTVPRLAPLHQVLRRITVVQGIHHAVPLRFDEELRSCPAEDFIAALDPAIELRGLVMTAESAFGRGREGTVERMRQVGAQRGFDVVGVEPLMADGTPVSSTRVRRAIAAGDVAAATAMGTAPYLEGTVVVGDRRGRKLGFPTANLAFDYTPAMPALGIYLGHVAVPDRGVGPAHPALVSVGVRPTFHDEARVLVEAYLLDYDGDLYGVRLALELTARLRDERRFPDATALVEQMRRDEAEARRLLDLG